MKNYISIFVLLLLGQLGYAQPCALTVQNSVLTPCGTVVTNADPYDFGFTETEANYEKYLASLQYPCATWVRHATTTFNCYGYGFHISTNTTQSKQAIWINDPQLYYDDGCYSSTTNLYKSKARYFNSAGIQHVAIVFPSTTTFRSKWGAWPLFQAVPLCVPPSYGTTINYVRRTGFTSSEVASQAIDAGDVYELNWEMSQEQEGVSGFNLLYVGEEGLPITINKDLIPSNSYQHIQMNGDQYSYSIDATDLDIEKVYLEILLNDGTQELMPFKG